MKILIASDSYKGSLSSLEVSKSIQKGFKEVFEDVSFKTLSMADGGEGTTQAIVESLNGQYITIDCHNALQEPIQASYGITSQGAIIEMASHSGLPLVKEKKIRVVLIAAPSSSGKTSFAYRLCIHLKVNGLNPVSISLDDYFFNREDTPLDEFGKYDFESIYAIDLEKFNSDLKS